MWPQEQCCCTGLAAYRGSVQGNLVLRARTVTAGASGNSRDAWIHTMVSVLLPSNQFQSQSAAASPAPPSTAQTPGRGRGSVLQCLEPVCSLTLRVSSSLSPGSALTSCQPFQLSPVPVLGEAQDSHGRGGANVFGVQPFPPSGIALVCLPTKAAAICHVGLWPKLPI